MVRRHKPRQWYAQFDNTITVQRHVVVFCGERIDNLTLSSGLYARTALHEEKLCPHTDLFIYYYLLLLSRIPHRPIAFRVHCTPRLRGV